MKMHFFGLLMGLAVNLAGHDRKAQHEPAGCEPHRERLAQLARNFAPEMREHPLEPYPLANIEWFLEVAGLGLVVNNRLQVLIEPGEVTIEKLENLYLEIHGHLEPVMRKTGEEGLIDTLVLFLPPHFSTTYAPTCYAYPRYTNNDRTIDISYIFFTPRNGAVSSKIRCLDSIFAELLVGAHQGDWEHITVRLDNHGERVLGVYYASHGLAEGKWYVFSNRSQSSEHGYKINTRGQIVTWCALETHGNHNRAEVIARTPLKRLGKLMKRLGILADITSNNGRYYDCQEILEVIEGPTDPHLPWLRFRGRFGLQAVPTPLGVQSPEGPAFKVWWEKEPEGPEGAKTLKN